MAFGKIAAATLVAGKTVALKLDMLPGQPVVHVEHLGETNEDYWNDQIARANTQDSVSVGRRAGGGKITRKTVHKRREKDRETLTKYAVRHLEAKHDDGRDATDADIPEFMQSIPPDVVDTIRDFVLNEENFREGIPESDPQELAGKS